MDVRTAPDAEQASALAANIIARRLRGAVQRRGTASVAFSGGRGPERMIELLATSDVPWRDITVYQVDERVAPDGHPARNLGLLEVLPLRRGQLKAMPVTASRLAGAARRYERSLPERFDVVHLGMGTDGHTASWPPGDPVVDADGLVAVCGEFDGFVRMTLTPRAVNAARMRLMFVLDESKASTVARWLAGDESLPAHLVRRTDTVAVLDAAAAGAR